MGDRKLDIERGRALEKEKSGLYTNRRKGNLPTSICVLVRAINDPDLNSAGCVGILLEMSLVLRDRIEETSGK